MHVNPGIHALAALTALSVLFTSAAAQAEDDDPGPLVERRSGRLHLVEDRQGDRIPDFSWAGYRGGGVAIPEVPARAAVEPQPEGDDTARIQAAIDHVSALDPDSRGHRGAVVLRRGTFRVNGTLDLHTSGVVLRGEGQGRDGSVILATAARRNDLIRVGGGSPPREIKGTRQPITDPRVPVGSRTLTVRDGAGFKPGDEVEVERAANQAWIETLGMHLFSAPNRPWQPAEYHLQFERRIVGVDGNRLLIDVPLVQAIEEQWGGGSVYKIDTSSRIREAGVERLRLVFDRESAGQGTPNILRNAVVFSNVADAWMREVTVQHFAYSAASLGRQARRVTVVDSANLDMHGTIGGGWRYAFANAGQQNLFMRCLSRTGRHDFTQHARVCGPNAFVDCLADHALSLTEPHHRWSAGLLYDNVLVTGPQGVIAVGNRGDSGTGHGWSGAWTILWNCGSHILVVMDPPTARNMVVGVRPTPDSTDAFNRWRTWFQNQGGVRLQTEERVAYLHRHSVFSPDQPVQPRSLYLEQLRTRLGDAAVEAITTPAQRSGDTESIARALRAMAD